MKLKLLIAAFAATALVGCGEASKEPATPSQSQTQAVQTTEGTATQSVEPARMAEQGVVAQSKEMLSEAADQGKVIVDASVERAREVAAELAEQGKQAAEAIADKTTAAVDATGSAIEQAKSSIVNEISPAVKTESTPATDHVSTNMDKIMGKMQTLTYQCGTNQIEVAMNNESNDLMMNIDGVNQTLALVESASGAKYSNDTYSFWTKNGEATLMKGDETLFSNCMIKE